METTKIGRALLWSVTFSLLISSCDKHETRYDYFSNGKVKFQRKYLQGKLDGESIEYYENGSVLKKQEWKNGVPNGDFTIYYPDGVVKTQGIVKNDLMENLTRYYPNGRIYKQERYDAVGDISEVIAYQMDGSRDTTVLIFPYIVGGAANYHEPAAIRIALVNFSDSLKYDEYKNGYLLISTGFDSVRNQIVDTVAIIEEKKPFFYEFNFTPNVEGENKLIGEFYFQKEINGSLRERRKRFGYNFYVKK